MENLKGIKRFDIGQIGEVEVTPQGFFKVPGFATRTGVFTYRDASGKVRRELRHPDDVFDPESLATLRNAPVTLEHPPVMLTPENVKQYMKGYTTDRVEVNRDLIETDLIIASEDAIKAVQDGVRELSSGYLADLEEEHGVYNGAEYDYRQKNIKYNHLALVNKGRAGPEVRLRLDSDDAMMEGQVVETPAAEFQPEGENDNMDNEKGEVKTVVVSGRKVDMPSWLADIWNDMSDRYDQMRGQIMKLEEDMSDEKRKDVDISQKNVSPQVKVEQKAPDGRGAAGKVGPSDRSGAPKAKGLDEDEHGIVGGPKSFERGKAEKELKDEEPAMDEDDKKKDGEEEEEKKDYEGAGGDGVAQSPVQQLKDAMEEMKAAHGQQMDAMQAKLDEYASASMAGGEHKMDRMDSKSYKTAVRKRVALERNAEKLLPVETIAKFDSMSDDAIRAAVIKHRHPNADLTGKSSVYLESRFDSIIETVEGSASVRREMGSHLLSTRMDSEPANPAQKRREMIENSRKLWNSNLSASKK